MNITPSVVNKLNILYIVAFMHKVETKTSPLFFNGRLQRISHYYTIRPSALNFSKPKLKLTKAKYIISIRDPTILNYFVEECLKSLEKSPVFKVKVKSKLMNFDNEISYF